MCRSFRNDAITVADVARLKPEYLVISGPCAPARYQVAFRLLPSVSLPEKFPFGVCLGHPVDRAKLLVEKLFMPSA